MSSNVLELRKYPRVDAESCSLPKGVPPNHAAVVNVSHGGACLWLRDVPPRDPGLAIQFQCDGQDHVLRSRLVWSKRCTAATARRHRAPAGGWLAGVAFAKDEEDVLLSDNPLDILRAGRVAVYPHALEEGPGALAPEHGRRQNATAGAIAFTEQAVVSAKAVANELVPIFAKHFSGIHMVLTRDRLVIDASFRTPEAPMASAAPRVEHRVEAATRSERAPVAQSVAPLPPPSGKVEPSAASLTPNGARKLVGSGLGLMAVSLIAAVILAATMLWSNHKSGDAPVTRGTSTERPSLPQWTGGLERSMVDDWLAVQKKFRMPDTAMSLTLQLLRANDKYAAGQSLYDLTRYPVQVGRAFSLVVAAQNGAPADFNRLMDDLQARVVQGVRFPDELPGGPYSSLQRELFNNIVVLAVIDVLRRHQIKPQVKEILAALKRSKAVGT